MAQVSPSDEEAFQPRESRLSDDVASYIAFLTSRVPGEIVFRTGAGRISRDLLLHWPTLEEREIEAQVLCNRITQAVFPLVGALYAQAVEISVNIFQEPIDPLTQIDALSSYVLFDPENRIERILFLSPRHALPPADLMRARKGIEVLCRPLHYRYHTIKDDRKRYARVRIGMYELPKRMLDELYEQPPFIQEEKKILEIVKTKVYELPKAVENYGVSREANLSLQSPHAPPPPAPAISTVTSLSALPPPLRALEHQLMSYVTNEGLSPNFRLGLRRVAQTLREIHPQALIEEAARVELTPLLRRFPQMAKAEPKMRIAYDKSKALSPKTVLVGEAGKLQKTARAALVQKSRAWEFPTPMPTPYPQIPSTKTRA